jgi:hypothetical protein
MKMLRIVLTVSAGLWLAAPYGAQDPANWPHWRGPNDNG